MWDRNHEKVHKEQTGEKTLILKDLNAQDEMCELKTAKRLELGSVRVMILLFYTQLYPGLS